jgi:Fis family transcriptional regulator
MTFLNVNEELEPRQETTTERPRVTLANYVSIAMEHYFKDLDGHAPNDLYRMVVSEVEKPLLTSVMDKVKGNQTRASEMLGITRSTLRKKLALHSLNN